MAKNEQLYWQGEHPLGGGKNRLTMGDPLPERMYTDTGEDGWEPDPRLEKWIEDKTVSTEAVVNFSKQKQNELEAAGEKIIILRDEVETLKTELTTAAKIAKSSAGSAAQLKKINALKADLVTAKADLATEKSDLVTARADLATEKTNAATAKTAAEKAMADEKVESGDVIAGLQLDIEELKKKIPKDDPKKSGPK